MIKASQKVYLLSSVLLGLLITTIFHALVELYIIQLLVTDYEKWSFGLSWGTIYIIHIIFGLTLVTVGVWGGLRVGRRWWKSVYIKRKKGLFLKIK